MADIFAAASAEATASIAGPEKPRRRSSRRSHGWTCLTAFAGEGTASVWEADRPGEGSIRLRHQAFLEKPSPGPRLASDLNAELAALGGLPLQPAGTLPGDPVRAREPRDSPALSHGGGPAGRDRGGRATLPCPRRNGSPGSTRLEEPSILVEGRTRPLYLALGCGAVAMIFVGLSVPGVPTVTFAVAAGYYLARSSIRLHGKVVRSRLFGPIVREWLARHGLSMGSKAKLIALTGGPGRGQLRPRPDHAALPGRDLRAELRRGLQHREDAGD